MTNDQSPLTTHHSPITASTQKTVSLPKFFSNMSRDNSNSGKSQRPGGSKSSSGAGKSRAPQSDKPRASKPSSGADKPRTPKADTLGAKSQPRAGKSRTSKLEQPREPRLFTQGEVRNFERMPAAKRGGNTAGKELGRKIINRNDDDERTRTYV